MDNRYMPRIADALLAERLEASGAVLIEGPKWCGKTRTAMEASESRLFMQDPDMRASYMKAADTKPSLLLKGKTPRLIDEWQTAPVLWDAVRYAVDRSGQPGQFILTGSAVPADHSTLHTGTGRISRMMMRPMSLYESGESNGTVSLKDLFSGKTDIASLSGLSIDQIARSIVRGGWPASVGEPERIAVRHAADYVDAIINQDVSRVDGVEKDPFRVRALMRSLSRNISTLATIKTISDDTAMGDSDSLSDKTVSQYLRALSRIFVTEDIPAWNPSLRSRAAVRTSAKRQFVDPSIAAAVMRMNSDSLLADFNYFGFLFESLCERDLRIYSEAIDGQVFHYRDSSGLECDAVIALHDGRWAAVEIKLGSKEIEEAAGHLIELKNKVNLDKMREPSFLMILTGTELAYRRDDGVLIVPIGCLKH